MKLLLTYITIVFLAIFASKPKYITENQPIRNIPIGYKIGTAGPDSVLIVKGKFVKEFQGKVWVKVN